MIFAGSKLALRFARLLARRLAQVGKQVGASERERERKRAKSALAARPPVTLARAAPNQHMSGAPIARALPARARQG